MSDIFYVPILNYHHISNNIHKFGTNIINRMVCCPSKFKEHMNYIKSEGYKTLFVRDLVENLKLGKIDKKVIIITFDDGYESFYEYAYPILKNLGLKATVGLVVNEIESGKTKVVSKLNWHQIKEAYESNLVEFQSHSYNMHGEYGCLEKPDEDLESYRKRMKEDYEMSKSIIEKKIGNKVNSYVYPFGFSSKWSEIILKECGCVCTFITNNKVAIIKKNEGLYGLDRIIVTNRTSLSKVLKH